MKTTQRGFTIIELVFVIAIIGILAAFAVPRFVDLQSDARRSNIRAMAGAARAASAMVHGKAIVEQKEKLGPGAATVTVEGGAGDSTVKLAWGYPRGTADGMGNAVTLDGNYKVSTDETAVPFSWIVEYTTDKTGATIIPNCSFTYTEPGAKGQAPSFSEDTSGC